MLLEAGILLGPDDPFGRTSSGEAREILEQLGARPLLALLDASPGAAPAPAITAEARASGRSHRPERAGRRVAAPKG